MHVGSELAAKVPGFSGKLTASETQVNERELTEGLERTLSETTSHLIQETEGNEHDINLQGLSHDREARLRRRYRPRYWDVYFHSFDYLELSHQSKFFDWLQIRKTIKSFSSEVLGFPLVRLTYYEPQLEIDVTYGDKSNVLETPDVIEIATLATPMPNSRAPSEDDLEQLAKAAFPVTRKERREAETKKAAKKVPPAARIKGAKKKGGRKRAAKKRGAKKKFAKKTAKKKAVRKKASKKKTSKKRSARAGRR